MKCCQNRTAQQGVETWQANPGHQIHPRGRSPGQLPDGLQIFPGLGGVLLWLRQQEPLGSILLPRRAFTGRSGEIFTLEGAQGVVVIPFWEGSSESDPEVPGCSETQHPWLLLPLLQPRLAEGAP